MSGLLAAAAFVVAAAPVDQQAVRLAGLARAWGYVKYVHPAMATSSIDWDAALVRSIPAVENAASEDAYRQAIAGLLAGLNDPVTRVVEDEPAVATAGAATAPVPMRLETVDAHTAVLVIPNDRALESTPNLQSEVCARFTEATRFERLVLDLRARPPAGLVGLSRTLCSGAPRSCSTATSHSRRCVS